MEKKFFAIGAFFAGLAVATGSYGAHGLQKIVPVERVHTWEKAVRYQMFHAFALFAVVWAMTQWIDQAKTLKAAGWSFIAGTVIFSGSVYIRVFTGDLETAYTTLINPAYITPLGGVLMIVGWGLLMWAALKTKE
ncbi:MAG: DUF423 domain-containing protein [Anaerolineae bacterium]|nr:DUF423 domain-containing protein [Anaerolineae bacterium]MBT3711941.1 DUF423 domain-containing protein [Anaerolineae bacterium]MBT4312176.1 DUF423 domain-containing protein [Anaerolineae bacterium]MBT4457072.1 DUF423 domain-containing protein [Anaerolineae bacterium]MBT6063152.1 DUF423 domain-containing protein [Anaerolineae bacterium]